jgi:hypothetical protein
MKLILNKENEKPVMFYYNIKDGKSKVAFFADANNFTDLEIAFLERFVILTPDSLLKNNSKLVFYDFLLPPGLMEVALFKQHKCCCVNPIFRKNFEINCNVLKIYGNSWINTTLFESEIRYNIKIFFMGENLALTNNHLLLQDEDGTEFSDDTAFAFVLRKNRKYVFKLVINDLIQENTKMFAIEAKCLVDLENTTMPHIFVNMRCNSGLLPRVILQHIYKNCCSLSSVD